MPFLKFLLPFLDLYLEFDDSGQLSTKIYDKRDFNFKIINFPNMCSNIPASPVYGIFTIWKCIAYNRFCRDGIYFDKILVSEYQLFKRSNKANQLSTKIYDKRDDFNFKIINFPNMCSNIPASPAYDVYISQLIRYARASSNYSDFKEMVGWIRL
jgi:hypothetical protein